MLFWHNRMVLGLFSTSHPAKLNDNGTLTYHDCIWTSTDENSPYPTDTLLHTVMVVLDSCILLIQHHEHDLTAVYRITTVTKTIVEGFTPTKRRKTDTPPVEVSPKLAALVSAAVRTGEVLKHKKAGGDPLPDVLFAGAKTHALLQAEQVMDKTHAPTNGVLEKISLDALSNLRNEAIIGEARATAANAVTAASCLENDDPTVAELQLKLNDGVSTPDEIRTAELAVLAQLKRKRNAHYEEMRDKMAKEKLPNGGTQIPLWVAMGIDSQKHLVSMEAPDASGDYADFMKLQSKEFMATVTYAPSGQPQVTAHDRELFQRRVNHENLQKELKEGGEDILIK